jgi:hypothetical protein
MSEPTSAPPSPPRRPLWTIPLRSDPPWLLLGLTGTTAASLALFAVLFRWLDPRVSLTLSLLPALTAATFLSAIVAWFGRRRGGSLSLHAQSAVLELRGPHEQLPWLDARDPSRWGVLVLEDPRSTARMFVLTQGSEPSIVLASREDPLPDSMKSRVITVDFSSLAVSAESAGAVEVALGASAAPLIETLAPASLDPREGPLWLRQPLPSGEVLALDDRRLRLGDRVISLDDPAVRARLITIGTPSGEVLGLSVHSDLTSVLLACVDPTAQGSTAETDAPDAYLHPAVFAALSSRLKATPQAPAPR